ncbi:MAG: protein phosphatase 2C domain-containing protein [Cyanobacteria bacterium KgW148]|nr:protein phosphatase 2C domain-containing protein [Cyanobacteria bacterium KgW148]
MKLLFAGDTDPGCVRSSNQDSFYIDPDARFFIVADGMGGHAGGEEASRLATATISAYLDRQWDKGLSAEELLTEAIIKANYAILSDQASHPERQDMGTTVVLLMTYQGQTWFSHIGDSRLYRLRNNRLEQLSDDHTWIARAIATGILTPEEARRHPWRHMLLQCLGREDIQLIETCRIDVEPGDQFLICSDGLTEELTDDLIQQIWSQTECSATPKNMIEAAKSRGGKDNITVVVVQNKG